MISKLFSLTIKALQFMAVQNTQVIGKKSEIMIVDVGCVRVLAVHTSQDLTIEFVFYHSR